MRSRIPMLVATAALAVAPLVHTVEAAVSVSTSNGLTGAGLPLAIHGFDPVAYFDKGAPVRGHAEHTAKWNGAAYRFSSAEHRRRFLDEPTRYAPQFGGFCAYGASVGAKFDGDPEVFRIVDGKLYFNLNPEIKATWEKNLRKNIAKAERQWPKIRNVPASEL